jgi:hypothetical protein
MQNEYQPTEEGRRRVRSLVLLGCGHDDIAMMMEIAPKTLLKNFRAELEWGAIEANVEVLDTLFTMATSGKNTTASIFWAKTHCGFGEKDYPSESENQPLPPFVLQLA